MWWENSWGRVSAESLVNNRYGYDDDVSGPTDFDFVLNL